MQNHPLTPMRDANLVRVLQAQCRRKVGLVDYPSCARVPKPIRRANRSVAKPGSGYCDRRCHFQRRLVSAWTRTGGLAAGDRGLRRGPRTRRQLRYRAVRGSERPARRPRDRGRISGSCSQATNRQVRAFVHREARPSGSTRCGSPAAPTSWRTLSRGRHRHLLAGRCCSIRPPTP